MRFPLFVIIIQAILFFRHWFFYRTMVRFFGVAHPGKLLALRLSLGLLSVSLIFTSILAFRYSNLLVRCLYTAAASWVGILYLLILASILCWIFYGLGKLFHIALDLKVLVEILIAMALIASLYGFINSGFVRIARMSLHLPNLPDQWKGKTAVWVSDTHLGHVRNYGFARRVAAMVKDLRPDILFIGGDLYDGTAVDLDRVIEPFSQISAPYGIFFITGNHEEFADERPYLQAVRRAGMRVLDNEMVAVEGLQIIGVDYRDTRSEVQFKVILEKMGFDPRKPSILLKHAPYDLHVGRDQGISFQISGHTHRGQVFLFRFITSRLYKGFDYGLKQLGGLLVYTSSGAGTWGPPMRLDTIPEIVVITLEN